MGKIYLTEEDITNMVSQVVQESLAGRLGIVTKKNTQLDEMGGNIYATLKKYNLLDDFIRSCSSEIKSVLNVKLNPPLVLYKRVSGGNGSYNTLEDAIKAVAGNEYQKKNDEGEAIDFEDGEKNPYTSGGLKDIIQNTIKFAKGTAGVISNNINNTGLSAKDAFARGVGMRDEEKKKKKVFDKCKSYFKDKNTIITFVEYCLEERFRSVCYELEKIARKP